MSVRVGVIGAGRRMFTTYVSVLQALILKKYLQIEAICDTRVERAGKLGELIGVANVYESVAEMITSHDLDGVIVAIPAKSKDKVVLEVLDYNLHVFIETPMAWHPGVAQKIRKVANKTRRIIEVAEDEAFWPIASNQAEQIKYNALGNLLHVRNFNKEYAYHGLARLNRLLTAKEKPVLYRQNMVRFASGVVYEYRFNSRSRRSKRDTSIWEIEGERGVLRDTNEREFHEHGLQYLLEGWVRAVENGERVRYGADRAASDVVRWRAMEAVTRLPDVWWPAGIIEPSVSLMWSGYSGLRTIKI